MARTLEENLNFVLKNVTLTGTYVSDRDGKTVVQYELNGYSEIEVADTLSRAIDNLVRRLVANP